MMTNLISILTNSFDDLFVNNTANTINEQPSTIKKLLTGIVPTILLSMINRKGSLNAESFKDLFGISKMFQGGNNTTVNESNILRNAIFGGQTNQINHELANFADVTPQNAERVLDIATPQILNTLSANKPSDIGILDWLWQQKNDILASVPHNLNLASAFGVSSLANLFDSKPNATTPAHDYNHTVQQKRDYIAPENERKSSNSFLWILLLAIAGLLAWWLFGKGCNEETQKTVVKTDSVITNTTTTINTETVTTSKLDADGNYIYDVGANTELKLADGTTMTVGNNSTEYKLFDFLTNGTVDENDKTKNWITCDRVYFKTSGTELTDASKAQIENIARILKNFPKASIKIGGYTDNTGDASFNKKLSADRAKIVAKNLADLGISNKQVVEAEGYGSDHPIATNDTDEGRAQNRRVDLKVASK